MCVVFWLHIKKGILPSQPKSSGAVQITAGSTTFCDWAFSFSECECECQRKYLITKTAGYETCDSKSKRVICRRLAERMAFQPDAIIVFKKAAAGGSLWAPGPHAATCSNRDDTIHLICEWVLYIPLFPFFHLNENYLANQWNLGR